MEDKVLLEYRDRLSEILWVNLVPFWTENAADVAYGGFHGFLDREGKPSRPHAGKSLVQTARFLWSFSALYQFKAEPEFAELADHGLDFLEEAYRDQECGGWYYATDRCGQVTDSSKHLYAQVYCLYGLAEYAYAFPTRITRGRALELFHLIETHCRDKEYSGYLESFDREWKPLPQRPEFGRGDQCTKSYNAHLHLMEAYTSLYRATRDENAGVRLEESINILLDQIIDPSSYFGRSFFQRDWTPIPSEKSYGHDIEASWLLDDAAATLGCGQENRIRKTVVGLADAVLCEGFDHQRGGLVMGGGGKSWWEQAEALIGFLNAYTLTEDRKFLEAFRKTLNWVEDSQIDREHGEWYTHIATDGRIDAIKSTVWKTPYHTVRACIECLKRMSV